MKAIVSYIVSFSQTAFRAIVSALAAMAVVNAVLFTGTVVTLPIAGKEIVINEMITAIVLALSACLLAIANRKVLASRKHKAKAKAVAAARQRAVERNKAAAAQKAASVKAAPQKGAVSVATVAATQAKAKAAAAQAARAKAAQAAADAAKAQAAAEAAAKAAKAAKAAALKEQYTKANALAKQALDATKRHESTIVAMMAAAKAIEDTDRELCLGYVAKAEAANTALAKANQAAKKYIEAGERIKATLASMK